MSRLRADGTVDVLLNPALLMLDIDGVLSNTMESLAVELFQASGKILPPDEISRYGVDGIIEERFGHTLAEWTKVLWRMPQVYAQSHPYWQMLRLVRAWSGSRCFVTGRPQTLAVERATRAWLETWLGTTGDALYFWTTEERLRMYGSLTSGGCLLVEDNPGVVPLLLERLHERLDVWILDRPWTRDAPLRFVEGGELPPANLHFGSETELAEALGLKV